MKTADRPATRTLTQFILVFVMMGVALVSPLVVVPVAALPIQDPTNPTGPGDKLPENPSPATPVPASITDRTSDQLTVRWNGAVKAGEQYQLQHASGSSGWTFLASLSASPTQVNHTGLLKDTPHCYRVQATNAYGSRSSAARCGFTTDGTSRKVWRAQIRFHTADVGDAGTDDSIYVQLNDQFSVPGGNFTWVDYGRDDFERGDTFTYDLDLADIPFFSDITQVRISKTGDNGLCLADFSLIVNGVTVYTEDFSGLPSHCRWLDSDVGSSLTYVVGHAQLRAHPLWQAYAEPSRISLDLSQYPLVTATLRIPREETESRIEAMIGDLIHGTEAKWGHKYGRASVEATQGGYHRLHVDLDLEASVPYWFNPELDIDFDLFFEASCSADQTQAIAKVTTQNLQATIDFDWFAELLSFILPCGPIVSVIEDEGIPDCISALETYIGNRIEASFTPPDPQNMKQALPQGFLCISADVVIDANANVDLVYRVQAPPPPAPPRPVVRPIFGTPGSVIRR